jgi:hypothetical protein
LAWVDDLHKRMEEEHLSAGGRLICPFLRPNFITRRQYETLVKTGEALISAIDRMQRMVLESPSLLARMELLPAEKMLAAIDPGYQVPEVAARLDSHLATGRCTWCSTMPIRPPARPTPKCWPICSTIRRR